MQNKKFILQSIFRALLPKVGALQTNLRALSLNHRALLPKVGALQINLGALLDSSIILQQYFIKLQKGFIMLQNSFIMLKNHFIMLQNDFIILKNHSPPILKQFCKYLKNN